MSHSDLLWAFNEFVVEQATEENLMDDDVRCGRAPCTTAERPLSWFMRNGRHAPPDEPGNPYLSEFIAHRGWYSWVEARTGRSWIDRRQLLVAEYAWALPNDSALKVLSALAPLVEVGAGGGYWAFLLRGRGVDIAAFDIANGGYRCTKRWTAVADGDHRVLRSRASRTRALFLCWPPYATPMAWQCLRAYRGNWVAYVGEGAGGCTGDDCFHEELEKRWDLVQQCAIPQWWGIHDQLWIYRRRPVAPITRQGVPDLDRLFALKARLERDPRSARLVHLEKDGVAW